LAPRYHKTRRFNPIWKRYDIAAATLQTDSSEQATQAVGNALVEIDVVG
jgi:hypothetical protein